MEKRIAELRSLKEGRYILIDDVPCRISKMSHSKPGKHGGAKVNIEGTGIFDGKKRNLMKPASDKTEVPVIDKRVAQVLTKVQDNVQLMDMESYETFDIPMPQDPETANLMQEGKEVFYISWGAQKKITAGK
ncbi:MAG: translation initiation factor IF-5A [Candidatus Altiarchaeales archaeon]|nr:translation initiation factor IF-5A [Candidatus Altiarchaeales archaeon]